LGLIHPGVPHSYVLGLKSALGVDSFVECGTFEGTTAAWAAAHFSHVTTIELSEALHRRAGRSLARYPNVTALLGDSRDHLARLVPALRPSIVWLDAHWSAGETEGKQEECPLLGELEILRPYCDKLFLLVDDARFFLAPPPFGHDPTHWPTLPEVVNALNVGEGRFIACFEDIIVSLPNSARDLTRNYIRQGGRSNESVVGADAVQPRRGFWERLAANVRLRHSSMRR